MLPELLWEMPSTCFCGASGSAFDFGSYFSSGFTHGTLLPFDASILQEFTPIGRGFIVTLRGRILDVRRRKRERESIQQDPWIGSQKIS